jgi:hypothetical protein
MELSGVLCWFEKSLLRRPRASSSGSGPVETKEAKRGNDPGKSQTMAASLKVAA